jgi:hypothetical protein
MFFKAPLRYFWLNVRGKVAPVLKTKYNAMNSYWGSGGIAPHMHNLDAIMK